MAGIHLKFKKKIIATGFENVETTDGEQWMTNE